MRSSWPKHLARGTVVRFSIGLEAVEDLQSDLLQALAGAFA
jgi:cystathionine beta-lyase